MDLLTRGTRLGRYTLDRRLALGGMAEVWLAREVGGSPERSLALKILLPAFTTDVGARAMFFDEANIASRLAHENIVRVYEAFEAQGYLVQSMELVDGRDLRRTLSAAARQGLRVPVPLALRVAREVALALDHAHRMTTDEGEPLGIIHRDVSPHNVMLTRDGGVKLLDFGIARAAERITRTRTGVIKGKLSYMAPEQALAVSVSQRSDIFSAGILLWEMLAMQRLFKAAGDAEVMERVIAADVPPVRAYNPDVPEPVAVLLGQMLAKREALRPESMRAVAARLDQAMADGYGPAETSRAALAAWCGALEDPATRVFPVPAAAGDGAVSSDLPAMAPPPELAVDRTQTMAPSAELGASGAHRVDAPPPPEAPPAPAAAGAAALRLRRPTRTEIVRAIDGVKTEPLTLDQAATLRPPAPLPRVLTPPARGTEGAALALVPEGDSADTTERGVLALGPSTGPRGPAPGDGPPSSGPTMVGAAAGEGALPPTLIRPRPTAPEGERRADTPADALGPDAAPTTLRAPRRGPRGAVGWGLAALAAVIVVLVLLSLKR